MATLTTSFQRLGEAYLGTDSYNHSLYVRIYARYTEQDIANNRTYVIYQARTQFNGTYIQDNQGSYSLSGTGVNSSSGSCTRPTNGEVTIATIEGWVYHDDRGEKSVSASVTLNFPNWGWKATASGSADLPTIPRKAIITNAVNFTDEENPKINYSNLAGNSVDSLQIKLAVENHTIDPIVDYIDIPKIGNEYEIILTNEQRKKLRQYVMNPKAKVYYVLKTVIGGNNFTDNVTKEVTIINANPQFNDFDWETINYNSLTGNNKTVIKDYSNIKTIVSEQNKAIGLKEAIITSYQTTIGSKSVTNNNIAYPVENVIQKVDGASITVFANDSRGNSTPIIKPISNYIEYKKIIGSISNLERTQQVNSEVNLQVEGEIDLVNFGAIVNSVVSAKYYYKETSSNDDFVEGTTKLNATLTQIEGTKYKYEIDQNIAGDLGANGFDINKSFLIKIVINDELDFAEDTETLGNGSPAIAVKGNCVSLGAPYNESIGGRVQINGDLYEGGSSTEIYSTEEQIIGTWIDGSKIYRRVVDYTLGSSVNTYKNIITIPNIKEMVNAYGWFTNNDVQFRFPNSYDNEDIMIYLDQTNHRIREQHNYSYANDKPAYIVLEYTKTTD